MQLVQLTSQEQKVLDAMRASPTMAGILVAMVEVAQNGELAAKSPEALVNASATLPDPKAAPTVSIAEMKEVLRAADCLYDDRKIWKQLGATKVPRIPDTVIREAYEKGGRVILRCSSINEKTEVLRKANCRVVFEGMAEQRQRWWGRDGSKTEWIVVPAPFNRSKSTVPAPTKEDWFSALAYARLDGGREPKGCEGRYVCTTTLDTVVGSTEERIYVLTEVYLIQFGNPLDPARFGPPQFYFGPPQN